MTLLILPKISDIQTLVITVSMVFGDKGGMGDTMQLMQLLSSIGGMGKGGSPLGQSGGGMNPLMLAQLLGNMMGRR